MKRKLISLAEHRTTAKKKVKSMQKLLTIKDASKTKKGFQTHFPGTQKRPKVRIEGKLDIAFLRSSS